MSYTSEPWFALLQGALGNLSRKDVATRLGVSAPLLSQVLNGSGKYGTGEAGTARFGERVMHTFGVYECPHLTEQAGYARLITAAECRVFAHRPAPVGSPRDMQHWQACNGCAHKSPTTPPVAREVKPRKRRSEPSTESTPSKEKPHV